jgi:hypothetical protein
MMDNLWLIKTNSSGDTLWTRVYGREGFGRHDLGYSVNQTKDGGFIIAGYTRFVIGDYDLWILRTDTMGDTLWTKTMGGMEYDDGRDVKQCQDNGYIITGCTSSKLWMVRLEPDSPNVVIDYDDIIPSDFCLSQNYPNPFNPSTKIKFTLPSSGITTLKIFNALGETVEVLVKNELNAGTYKVEWDASTQQSGVYFYQLQSNQFVETKKMILIK